MSRESGPGKTPQRPSKGSAPKSAKALSTRALASLVLNRVLSEGRSLDAAEAQELAGLPAGSVRSAVRALCYGTLRFAHRLQPVLDQLLHRPLPPRQGQVRCLALLGLYELIYEGTAPHAAVHEAGEAARQLDRKWAVKLINAILRNFQRRGEQILNQVDRKPAFQYAHPEWLFGMLNKQWPEDWASICEANNQRPPMWLRVNLGKVSRDEYQSSLSEAGLASLPGHFNRAALCLTEPCAVEMLPGFDQGLVSVQDGAAQLVAPLVAAQPGHRILDACAAPGGKTGHLLELYPEAQVSAMDISEQRLERVAQTVERLGAEAGLICADAAASDQWWDGRLFDRILIDAPCSGTGVIRRHPDIKSLRRPEDLPAMAEKQRRLVQSLWALLAPGGRMVYTTCSVMANENQDSMAFALKNCPGAKPINPASIWTGTPGPTSGPAPGPTLESQPAPGRKMADGWQILPGEADLDGFFYAALEREP